MNNFFVIVQSETKEVKKMVDMFSNYVVTNRRLIKLVVLRMVLKVPYV